MEMISPIDPIVSRVRTDITAVRDDRGMRWTKQPLTQERLEVHLSGGPSRGTCPIKAGESTTRLAVLDFDSHKGETSLAEMAAVAMRVRLHLDTLGMKTIAFRSRGGKGIHLFMLWDEPQDAYSVRQFLKAAITDLGYNDGTGGVVNKQIEIFPKQDSVPIGGCGSQFILPLAGHSVPLDHLVGYDVPLDKEYTPDLDWSVSLPVPRLEKKKIQPIPQVYDVSPDFTELAELLEHIDPDVPRDQWIKVGMAIHYETHGSEDGFQLFNNWSADGGKYNTEEELRHQWDSFKLDTERPVTKGTIVKIARENGFVADILREFDDLDKEAVRQNGERFKVMTAAEFAAGNPPSWLIKGVLPEAGLAMVYGESGAGKTFFVLDMVASIARDVDWRGHKVKKGRVVYIAAEGAGGFRKRLNAYASHHNIPLDELDVGIIADAPNLHQNDSELLIKQINQHGNVAVIVVDTLAQVTPGANENSGEDMGMVVNRCKHLHEQTGALVVLVHHSGKDHSRGARGWSGIKGALDAEIEVIKASIGSLARITKQKDGDGDASFAFKLHTVVLGADEDGDDITSCVVEHLDTPAPKATKLTGKWKIAVYEAVTNLAALGDSRTPIASIIAEAIRGTAYDAGPNPEKPKRDSRRESARRALDELSKDGLITIDGGMVYLPQSRKSPQIENCGVAE